MSVVIRILLTFGFALFAFEWMVQAFHLMNEPSDRALYTGIAMLAALGIVLPAVLWRLWRRKL